MLLLEPPARAITFPHCPKRHIALATVQYFYTIVRYPRDYVTLEYIVYVDDNAHIDFISTITIIRIYAIYESKVPVFENVYAVMIMGQICPRHLYRATTCLVALLVVSFCLALFRHRTIHEI